MRPLPALLSVVAVVLLGVFAVGRSTLGTVAQNATPAGLAGHPVVGGWVWDTNADDPANALSYGAFHADGTYVEVHPSSGLASASGGRRASAPPT